MSGVDKSNRTTARKKGHKMNCTEIENQQQLQIDLISPIFDELVTSAIDLTLSKLGTKVKQVFYSFLENRVETSRDCGVAEALPQ